LLKSLNIKETTFISIIIPCRNEEKFIAVCLNSIIANDFPKDRFEVFAINGMSEDGAREVIGSYVQKHPWIKPVENPKNITPVVLNIGIKKCKK
jgi:succinoglycan biosynthesis protein ExoA